MKILWLLPNLHVGGGVRAALELGRQLVLRGNEFCIMIPRGRKKITLPVGIKLIECGLSVKSPLWAIPTGILSMALRAPKANIVIGSMPPYALLAQLIGWLQRIPSVNYVLNDDVRFFDDRTFIKSKAVLLIYRWLAWLSYKATIITNSHWTATRVVTDGGSKPVAIIPSGYDPVVFNARNAPGRSISETVLMTVGRRARWKGLVDLVHALNLIDANKYPFRLIVVTQEELDMKKANFKWMVATPKDDQELVSYYQSAHIYVHPSWFEGFGLPPLEAMACGTAVISTDSGGIREFLRSDENGLIVPPREPRTMADAIERLIADRLLRERLIEESFRTVTEFTWEKIATRFEDSLHNLIVD